MPWTSEGAAARGSTSYCESYCTPPCTSAPVMAPLLQPITTCDGEASDCPICLSEILVLNSVWTPCCARPFHDQCLSNHLKNQTKCPMCRTGLPDDLASDLGDQRPPPAVAGTFPGDSRAAAGSAAAAAAAAAGRGRASDEGGAGGAAGASHLGVINGVSWQASLVTSSNNERAALALPLAFQSAAWGGTASIDRYRDGNDLYTASAST